MDRRPPIHALELLTKARHNILTTDDHDTDQPHPTPIAA
jgi:hypothetical protein